METRVTSGPILQYPSLIDHRDKSRNFENSKQEGYLYYTLWEPRPHTDFERHLVRVPIRFSLISQ